jgi:acyl-CoA reductase-like NAD-dependent aldehyde dehydrogenase
MVVTSYDSLFIGGEWVRPSSSARIEVTSASTEENIGSVPEAAEADVDVAVAAARRAFDDPDGWSQWEPAARAAAIERLAAVLEARSAQLAEAVSRQNGMPISIATMLEGRLRLVDGRRRRDGPRTQIGPMASRTHRDRVEGYIAKGTSDGARLVTGGGRPAGLDRGWFVGRELGPEAISAYQQFKSIYT